MLQTQYGIEKLSVSTSFCMDIFQKKTFPRRWVSLDERTLLEYRVCYPAANSQSIIRDDIKIVIQLMKARKTEIWYFRHSSPKIQCSKSLKYKTVMPAEAEAAARDNVAVT